MSSLNDFEVIKLLGKGAFASVYQVKRKKDGLIYAMKKVNFGQMSSKEKDNALNEIRILASVKHTNIIGYMDSFYDDNTKSLNIIMEYADEGDIDGKLKKYVTGKLSFPENDVWSYLIQILLGLKALHTVKIMHRDLKLANIFVKGGVIKLGDLNVSKLIKRDGMDHTQTGTPYYASPEVWSDKPYDYKCDIWSVGCIVYELCAQKPPFTGNSLEDLYKAIIKGRYEPLPKVYSTELNIMIQMLLQVEPSKRPDVYTLLKHPYIVKRMDYSNNIDDFSGDNVQMIKTIKAPKNNKELNQQLPHGEFDIGKVEVKRKNSEENLQPRGNNYLNPEMKPKISPNVNIQNNYSNNYRPDINYINNKGLNPQVYNINSNNQNNIDVKYNPILNNPSNIIKNNPSSILPNNNQIQREDIIKKYNPLGNNNIIKNNNNLDPRVRPRTPDALPKNNVIIKSNPYSNNHNPSYIGGKAPQQQISNINSNNNHVIRR